MTIHTRAFQGTISPPARIVRVVNMSPGDAPFADLLRTCFGPELAGMIATLYGIEPVVAPWTPTIPSSEIVPQSPWEDCLRKRPQPLSRWSRHWKRMGIFSFERALLSLWGESATSVRPNPSSTVYSVNLTGMSGCEQ